jgi:hypothetical protein
MKLFFIFFNLFVFEYVSSQNYIDVLKVNLNTTPYAVFDSSDTKTRVKEVFFDLTSPIKLNDKWSIITGCIFESIQAKLFASQSEKTFGSTTLKLGFNKIVNDKYVFTFVLLPKIASDYKNIGNKDFQFGTLSLLKYKKNKQLSYKFGFYQNFELFGPLFVPMFGFYYLSPNKKLEANVFLPLQLDVNYKLSNRIFGGINFNGLIRTYHLTDINSSYKSSYLNRSTNDIYTYVKMNVTENISFQTKVGYSMARKFLVYGDGDGIAFALPATYIGDHRTPLNTKFSNGLLFQISFLYRIHLLD